LGSFINKKGHTERGKACEKIFLPSHAGCLVMIIRHLTIRDFGAVSLYDAVLTPELNIIDSRYTQEISAAIAFLLCSKAQQTIPPSWLRTTTRLAAEVLSETCVYTVTATPFNGQLTLSVTDNSGAVATDEYRYILCHCLEQDTIDGFDGQDKTLPMRLHWYRNYDDAPAEVSSRTESRIELKTFRAQLLAYIKSFQPEPINCKKNYFTMISPDGRFEVFDSGVSEKIHLSETEEKLFLYVCFLNVAEFWTVIEKIRDLHHEKKPLIIQNFLEFLDESTDVSALVARTIKLHRQIIILTLPLAGELKKKWSGQVCEDMLTDAQ